MLVARREPDRPQGGEGVPPLRCGFRGPERRLGSDLLMKRGPGPDPHHRGDDILAPQTILWDRMEPFQYQKVPLGKPFRALSGPCLRAVDVLAYIYLNAAGVHLFERRSKRRTLPVLRRIAPKWRFLRVRVFERRRRACI